ncbi:TRAP transporter substrate-binding protein [Desulfoluna spongiiphila]|uniref:Tripartite ATP-independent transporter solute receptor, DctP family n=1 Tax=Desulfoluna spongiiphila TaxID=419481 RepID=A0A1G5H3K1_9BACT|nr:TRAP transporter substrate-binding protein [Desulfoluna spongiiphila]SCY58452.1 tripartite ATP-independent transporter solute receptor, DctP family [Desulfoluna spongiiphila]VVS94788.1 trap transporter solute receptor dctp/teaa [Desulfoluna spongiiphila]
MFRKLCITAIAVLAMAFTVQGVSAKQIFRVGMGDAIESDQGAMAKQFKSLVESLSNGEIEVQLFPNGALGTETEMLQNSRRGTLDMAFIGVGNAVPFVKQLGTLTMPYLIESHFDAIKATTGGLGAHWNELAIEKGGFRILGWTYSNFRYITNSKRPVSKISDVKGLKIRIPQNKIIMATLKSWGANPVPMAWSETFTALQQGVVDGQENPYIVNYTTKFHEVQDYLTEVHYQYSLQPLIVGERSWKKYDDKTRALLTRAGIEAQQYCIAFQILEAKKAKEGMIKGGVEVSTLEDEEVWKKLAMEKVWPEYYDFIGGKENVDLVLKALGKK